MNGFSRWDTEYSEYQRELRENRVSIEKAIGFYRSEKADNNLTIFGNPSGATNTRSNYLLIDKELELVSAYNERRGSPNWSAWTLRKEHIGGTGRATDTFSPDTRLPDTFRRISSQDYVNSGYDRGHILPSGDRNANTELNIKTFRMTNIQPQAGSQNRESWRLFEESMQDLVVREDRVLKVIAGGAGSKGTIKNRGEINVPESTWKIIAVLEKGQKEVTAETPIIAVDIPNEQKAGYDHWTKYITTIQSIQEKTGLEIFSNVDKDTRTALLTRQSKDIAKDSYRRVITFQDRAKQFLYKAGMLQNMQPIAVGSLEKFKIVEDGELKNSPAMRTFKSVGMYDSVYITAGRSKNASLPFLPTQLEDSYYNKHYHEAPPVVNMYSEMYSYMNLEEPTKAVAKMDAALGRGTLRNRINRGLGAEWLLPEMNVIGSGAKQLGRGLDYLFGYYDYLDEKHYVNQPNRGTVGGLLKIQHKRPNEDEGFFSTFMETLYTVPTGSAVAIGSYMAVNLPMQHIRAKLESDFLLKMFEPEPYRAPSNPLARRGRYVLGGLTAVGIGYGLNQVEALQGIGGGLSTIGATLALTGVIHPRVGLGLTAALAGNLIGSSINESVGGMAGLAIGGTIGAFALRGSFKQTTLTMVYGSPQGLMIDLAVERARYKAGVGRATKADVATELKQIITNINTITVSGSYNVPSGVYRGGEEFGIQKIFSKEHLNPNKLLQENFLTLEGSREAGGITSWSPSWFAALQTAREIDKSRFDTVIAPMLQAVNPYNYMSGSNLYNVFNQSIVELSETIGAPARLHLTSTKGDSPTIKLTNVTQDRISQMAKALDRVGYLLPLNIMYWIPGLRDALDLRKFNPKENLVWTDIFSLEEVSDWVTTTGKALGGLTGANNEGYDVGFKDPAYGNWLRKGLTAASEVPILKTAINITGSILNTARSLVVETSQSMIRAHRLYKTHEKLKAARAELRDYADLRLQEVNKETLFSPQQNDVESVRSAYVENLRRQIRYYNDYTVNLGEVTTSIEYERYSSILEDLEFYTDEHKSYYGDIGGDSKFRNPILDSSNPMIRESAGQVLKGYDYFTNTHGNYSQGNNAYIRALKTKKVIQYIGMALITDSALGWAFLDKGVDLFTQLRARGDLQDETGEEYRRFRLTDDPSTAVAATVGLASGSLAGYIFPDYKFKEFISLDQLDDQDYVAAKSELSRALSEAGASISGEVRTPRGIEIANTDELTAELKAVQGEYSKLKSRSERLRYGEVKFSKTRAWAGALVGILATRAVYGIAANIATVAKGDLDEQALDAKGAEALLYSLFLDAALNLTEENEYYRDKGLITPRQYVGNMLNARNLNAIARTYLTNSASQVRGDTTIYDTIKLGLANENQISDISQRPNDLQRVYNIATQQPLPFFQLSFLSRYEKGRLSLGVGFQLAPVTGLGVNLDLPISVVFQENMPYTKRQKAYEMFYGNQELNKWDSLQVTSNLAIGAFTLGSSFIYEEQNTYVPLVESLGTATLIGASIFHRRPIHKNVHAYRTDPRVAGSSVQLSNKLNIVDELLNNGVVRGGIAIGYNTSMNLAALPFTFSYHGLKAVGKTGIGKVGFATFGAMTIYSSFTKVYEAKGYKDAVATAIKESKGQLTEDEKVAAQQLSFKNLQTTQRLATLSAVGVGVGLSFMGIERAKAFRRVAAPWYIGATIAHILSRPGTQYKKGSGTQDQVEHWQATAGLGLAYGIAFSTLGVFNKREDFAALQLKWLRDNATRVREGKTEGTINVKEYGKQYFSNLFNNRRMSDHPHITQLAEGLKFVVDQLQEADNIDDVLRGNTNEKVQELKTVLKKKKLPFTLPFINNPVYRAGAYESLAAEHMLQIAREGYKAQRASASGIAEDVATGLPKKMMGDNPVARRVKLGIVAFASVLLVANAIDSLLPRGMRNTVQTTPFVGPSLRALTGQDPVNIVDDYRPNGFFLGKFLRKTFNSLGGWTKLFGTTYSDKPDPFLNIFGPAGYSMKETPTGYLQLATQGMDLSVSSFTMGKRDSRRAEELYSFIMSRGLSRNYQALMSLDRGWLNRSAPAKVEGLSRYEASQATGNLNTVLRIREYLTKNAAWQSAYEIQRDLLRTTLLANLDERLSGGVKWTPLAGILNRGLFMIPDVEQELLEEWGVPSGTISGEKKALKIGKDEVDAYIESKLYKDRAVYENFNLFSILPGATEAITKGLGNSWLTPVANMAALGLTTAVGMAGVFGLSATLAEIGRYETTYDLMKKSYVYGSQPLFLYKYTKFKQIEYNQKPMLVQMDISKSIQTGSVLPLDLEGYTGGAAPIQSRAKTFYRNLVTDLNIFYQKDVNRYINRASRLDSLDEINDLFYAVPEGASETNATRLKRRLRDRLRATLEASFSDTIPTLKKATVAQAFFGYDLTVDRILDRALGANDEIIDALIGDIIATNEKYLVKGEIAPPGENLQIRRALETIQTISQSQSTKQLQQMLTQLGIFEVDIHSDAMSNFATKKEMSQLNRLDDLFGRHTLNIPVDPMKPWSQGFLEEANLAARGGFKVLKGYYTAVPFYEGVEGFSLALDPSQPDFLRKSGAFTASQGIVTSGLAYAATMGLRFLGINPFFAGLLAAAGLITTQVLASRKRNWAEKQNQFFNNLSQGIVNVADGINRVPLLGRATRTLARGINWLTKEVTGAIFAPLHNKLLGEDASRWSKVGGSLLVMGNLLPMTAYSEDYLRRKQTYKGVIQQIRYASIVDKLPDETLVHPNVLGRPAGDKEEIYFSKYFTGYAGSRVLEPFSGGAYTPSNLLVMNLKLRQGLHDLTVTGPAAHRIEKKVDKTSWWKTGLTMAVSGLGFYVSTKWLLPALGDFLGREVSVKAARIIETKAGIHINNLMDTFDEVQKGEVGLRPVVKVDLKEGTMYDRGVIRLDSDLGLNLERLARGRKIPTGAKYNKQLTEFLFFHEYAHFNQSQKGWLNLDSQLPNVPESIGRLGDTAEGGLDVVFGEARQRTHKLVDTLSELSAIEYENYATRTGVLVNKQQLQHIKKLEQLANLEALHVMKVTAEDSYEGLLGQLERMAAQKAANNRVLETQNAGFSYNDASDLVGNRYREVEGRLIPGGATNYDPTNVRLYHAQSGRVGNPVLIDDLKATNQFSLWLSTQGKGGEYLANYPEHMKGAIGAGYFKTYGNAEGLLNINDSWLSNLLEQENIAYAKRVAVNNQDFSKFVSDVSKLEDNEILNYLYKYSPEDFGKVAKNISQINYSLDSKYKNLFVDTKFKSPRALVEITNVTKVSGQIITHNIEFSLGNRKKTYTLIDLFTKGYFMPSNEDEIAKLLNRLDFLDKASKNYLHFLQNGKENLSEEQKVFLKQEEFKNLIANKTHEEIIEEIKIETSKINQMLKVEFQKSIDRQKFGASLPKYEGNITDIPKNETRFYELMIEPENIIFKDKNKNTISLNSLGLNEVDQRKYLSYLLQGQVKEADSLILNKSNITVNAKEIRAEVIKSSGYKKHLQEIGVYQRYEYLREKRILQEDLDGTIKILDYENYRKLIAAEHNSLYMKKISLGVAGGLFHGTMNFAQPVINTAVKTGRTLGRIGVLNTLGWGLSAVSLAYDMDTYLKVTRGQQTITGYYKNKDLYENYKAIRERQINLEEKAVVTSLGIFATQLLTGNFFANVAVGVSLATLDKDWTKKLARFTGYNRQPTEFGEDYSYKSPFIDMSGYARLSRDNRFVSTITNYHVGSATKKGFNAIGGVFKGIGQKLKEPLGHLGEFIAGGTRLISHPAVARSTPYAIAMGIAWFAKYKHTQEVKNQWERLTPDQRAEYNNSFNRFEAEKQNEFIDVAPIVTTAAAGLRVSADAGGWFIKNLKNTIDRTYTPTVEADRLQRSVTSLETESVGRPTLRPNVAEVGDEVVETAADVENIVSNTRNTVTKKNILQTIAEKISKWRNRDDRGVLTERVRPERPPRTRTRRWPWQKASAGQQAVNAATSVTTQQRNWRLYDDLYDTAFYKFTSKLIGGLAWVTKKLLGVIPWALGKVKNTVVDTTSWAVNKLGTITKRIRQPISKLVGINALGQALAKHGLKDLVLGTLAYGFDIGMTLKGAAGIARIERTERNRDRLRQAVTEYQRGATSLGISFAGESLFSIAGLGTIGSLSSIPATNVIANDKYIERKTDELMEREYDFTRDILATRGSAVLGTSLALGMGAIGYIAHAKFTKRNYLYVYRTELAEAQRRQQKDFAEITKLENQLRVERSVAADRQDVKKISELEAKKANLEVLFEGKTEASYYNRDIVERINLTEKKILLAQNKLAKYEQRLERGTWFKGYYDREIATYRQQVEDYEAEKLTLQESLTERQELNKAEQRAYNRMSDARKEELRGVLTGEREGKFTAAEVSAYLKQNKIVNSYFNLEELEHTDQTKMQYRVGRHFRYIVRKIGEKWKERQHKRAQLQLKLYANIDLPDYGTAQVYDLPGEIQQVKERVNEIGSPLKGILNTKLNETLNLTDTIEKRKGIQEVNQAIENIKTNYTIDIGGKTKEISLKKLNNMVRHEAKKILANSSAKVNLTQIYKNYGAEIDYEIMQAGGANLKTKLDNLVGIYNDMASVSKSLTDLKKLQSQANKLYGITGYDAAITQLNQNIEDAFYNDKTRLFDLQSQMSNISSSLTAEMKQTKPILIEQIDNKLQEIERLGGKDSKIWTSLSEMKTEIERQYSNGEVLADSVLGKVKRHFNNVDSVLKKKNRKTNAKTTIEQLLSIKDRLGKEESKTINVRDANESVSEFKQVDIKYDVPTEIDLGNKKITLPGGEEITKVNAESIDKMILNIWDKPKLIKSIGINVISTIFKKINSITYKKEANGKQVIQGKDNLAYVKEKGKKGWVLQTSETSEAKQYKVIYTQGEVIVELDGETFERSVDKNSENKLVFGEWQRTLFQDGQGRLHRSGGTPKGVYENLKIETSQKLQRGEFTLRQIHQRRGLLKKLKPARDNKIKEDNKLNKILREALNKDDVDYRQEYSGTLKDVEIPEVPTLNDNYINELDEIIKRSFPYEVRVEKSGVIKIKTENATYYRNVKKIQKDKVIYHNEWTAVSADSLQKTNPYLYQEVKNEIKILKGEITEYNTELKQYKKLARNTKRYPKGTFDEEISTFEAKKLEAEDRLRDLNKEISGEHRIENRLSDDSLNNILLEAKKVGVIEFQNVKQKDNISKFIDNSKPKTAGYAYINYSEIKPTAVSLQGSSPQLNQPVPPVSPVHITTPAQVSKVSKQEQNQILERIKQEEKAIKFTQDVIKQYDPNEDIDEIKDLMEEIKERSKTITELKAKLGTDNTTEGGFIRLSRGRDRQSILRTRFIRGLIVAPKDYTYSNLLTDYADNPFNRGVSGIGSGLVGAAVFGAGGRYYGTKLGERLFGDNENLVGLTASTTQITGTLAGGYITTEGTSYLMRRASNNKYLQGLTQVDIGIARSIAKPWEAGAARLSKGLERRGLGYIAKGTKGSGLDILIGTGITASGVYKLSRAKTEEEELAAYKRIGGGTGSTILSVGLGIVGFSLFGPAGLFGGQVVGGIIGDYIGNKAAEHLYFHNKRKANQPWFTKSSGYQYIKSSNLKRYELQYTSEGMKVRLLSDTEGGVKQEAEYSEWLYLEQEEKPKNNWWKRLRNIFSSIWKTITKPFRAKRNDSTSASNSDNSAGAIINTWQGNNQTIIGSGVGASSNTAQGNNQNIIGSGVGASSNTAQGNNQNIIGSGVGASSNTAQGNNQTIIGSGVGASSNISLGSSPLDPALDHQRRALNAKELHFSMKGKKAVQILMTTAGMGSEPTLPRLITSGRRSVENTEAFYFHGGKGIWVKPELRRKLTEDPKALTRTDLFILTHEITHFYQFNNHFDKNRGERIKLLTLDDLDGLNQSNVNPELYNVVMAFGGNNLKEAVSNIAKDSVANMDKNNVDPQGKPLSQLEKVFYYNYEIDANVRAILYNEKVYNRIQQTDFSNLTSQVFDIKEKQNKPVRQVKQPYLVLALPERREVNPHIMRYMTGNRNEKPEAIYYELKRLMFAEARGEGKAGQAAVASSILLRYALLKTGAVGSNTYATTDKNNITLLGVMQGRGQFSPYDRDSNRGSKLSRGTLGGGYFKISEAESVQADQIIHDIFTIGPRATLIKYGVPPDQATKIINSPNFRRADINTNVAYYRGFSASATTLGEHRFAQDDISLGITNKGEIFNKFYRVGAISSTNTETANRQAQTSITPRDIIPGTERIYIRPEPKPEPKPQQPPTVTPRRNTSPVNTYVKPEDVSGLTEEDRISLGDIYDKYSQPPFNSNQPSNQPSEQTRIRGDREYTYQQIQTYNNLYNTPGNVINIGDNVTPKLNEDQPTITITNRTPASLNSSIQNQTPKPPVVTNQGINQVIPNVAASTGQNIKPNTNILGSNLPKINRDNLLNIFPTSIYNQDLTKRRLNLTKDSFGSDPISRYTRALELLKTESNLSIDDTYMLYEVMYEDINKVLKTLSPENKNANMVKQKAKEVERRYNEQKVLKYVKDADAKLAQAESIEDIKEARALYASASQLYKNLTNKSKPDLQDRIIKLDKVIAHPEGIILDMPKAPSASISKQPARTKLIVNKNTLTNNLNTLKNIQVGTVQSNQFSNPRLQAYANEAREWSRDPLLYRRYQGLLLMYNLSVISQNQNDINLALRESKSLYQEFNKQSWGQFDLQIAEDIAIHYHNITQLANKNAGLRAQGANENRNAILANSNKIFQYNSQIRALDPQRKYVVSYAALDQLLAANEIEKGQIEKFNKLETNPVLKEIKRLLGLTYTFEERVGLNQQGQITANLSLAQARFELDHIYGKLQEAREHLNKQSTINLLNSVGDPNFSAVSIGVNIQNKRLQYIGVIKQIAQQKINVLTAGYNQQYSKNGFQTQPFRDYIKNISSIAMFVQQSSQYSNANDIINGKNVFVNELYGVRNDIVQQQQKVVKDMLLPLVNQAYPLINDGRYYRTLLGDYKYKLSLRQYGSRAQIIGDTAILFRTQQNTLTERNAFNVLSAQEKGRYDTVLSMRNISLDQEIKDRNYIRGQISSHNKSLTDHINKYNYGNIRNNIKSVTGLDVGEQYNIKPLFDLWQMIAPKSKDDPTAAKRFVNFMSGLDRVVTNSGATPEQRKAYEKYSWFYNSKMYVTLREEGIEGLNTLDPYMRNITRINNDWFSNKHQREANQRFGPFTNLLGTFLTTSVKGEPIPLLTSDSIIWHNEGKGSAEQPSRLVAAMYNVAKGQQGGGVLIGVTAANMSQVYGNSGGSPYEYNPKANDTTKKLDLSIAAATSNLAIEAYLLHHIRSNPESTAKGDLGLSYKVLTDRGILTKKVDNPTLTRLLSTSNYNRDTQKAFMLSSVALRLAKTEADARGIGGDKAAIGIRQDYYLTRLSQNNLSFEQVSSLFWLDVVDSGFTGLLGQGGRLNDVGRVFNTLREAMGNNKIPYFNKLTRAVGWLFDLVISDGRGGHINNFLDLATKTSQLLHSNYQPVIENKSAQNVFTAAGGASNKGFSGSLIAQYINPYLDSNETKVTENVDKISNVIARTYRYGDVYVQTLNSLMPGVTNTTAIATKGGVTSNSATQQLVNMVTSFASVKAYGYYKINPHLQGLAADMVRAVGTTLITGGVGAPRVILGAIFTDALISSVFRVGFEGYSLIRHMESNQVVNAGLNTLFNYILRPKVNYPGDAMYLPEIPKAPPKNPLGIYNKKAYDKALGLKAAEQAENLVLPELQKQNPAQVELPIAPVENNQTRTLSEIDQIEFSSKIKETVQALEAAGQELKNKTNVLEVAIDPPTPVNFTIGAPELVNTDQVYPTSDYRVEISKKEKRVIIDVYNENKYVDETYCIANGHANNTTAHYV